MDKQEEYEVTMKFRVPKKIIDRDMQERGIDLGQAQKLMGDEFASGNDGLFSHVSCKFEEVES